MTGQPPTGCRHRNYHSKRLEGTYFGDDIILVSHQDTLSVYTAALMGTDLSRHHLDWPYELGQGRLIDLTKAPGAGDNYSPQDFRGTYAQRLRTILLDDVGALHLISTPSTPVSTGVPTDPAKEFVERMRLQLSKSGFEAMVAKSLRTKFVGSKEVKFADEESDLDSRFVTAIEELTHLLELHSSLSLPRFALDDGSAETRRETLPCDIQSWRVTTTEPAVVSSVRDWIEFLHVQGPFDGKWALLVELYQRPHYIDCEPFDATPDLLHQTLDPFEIPHEFNSDSSSPPSEGTAPTPP
ncbi:hypothetical protein CYMTET_20991 [Cymbomonas tetramitiformis]|uniref:Uncharacterized protein n=1 Tax=Cymbomonas tetramitiformis TaxID=36881 RepID=A0AAE0L3Q1_9CHLO|nr:hypothetical protein CYMTET_20991 [Cymbomonas tetramitiformis]